MADRTRYAQAYLLFLILWVLCAAYGSLTALSRPTAPSAIATAVGLLGLPPLWAWRRSSRDLTVSIALYALFLAGIDSFRRIPIYRFQRLYSEIRVGMDATDVETVARRRFPDRQLSVRLSETGGYIGLGPVLPGCGGDKIGVYMKNGRIESKLYLPD